MIEITSSVRDLPGQSTEKIFFKSLHQTHTDNDRTTCPDITCQPFGQYIDTTELTGLV